jgi:hypothetical protein
MTISSKCRCLAMMLYYLRLTMTQIVHNVARIDFIEVENLSIVHALQYIKSTLCQLLDRVSTVL